MLSDPDLVSNDEYKLILQGVSSELHEAVLHHQDYFLRLGHSYLTRNVWLSLDSSIPDCERAHNIAFLYQIDKH